MKWCRLEDPEEKDVRVGLLSEDAESVVLFPVELTFRELFGQDDVLSKHPTSVVPNPKTNIPSSTMKLLPPVPQPSKILCVGLNYRAHIMEFSPAETDLKRKFPLFFTKLPSAVVSDSDSIVWNPSETNAVDYEGELAVILKRTPRGVKAADALKYIAGFTLANDVTARDWQKSDGQWTRAKGCDTFCPLGPYGLSIDEVYPHWRDPAGCPEAVVHLRTFVNNSEVQSAQTSDMIFSIAELIEHVSSFCALDFGDVLLTGTPAGVGLGKDPPEYLQDRDVVVVRLDLQSGFSMELRNVCRTVSST